MLKFFSSCGRGCREHLHKREYELREQVGQQGYVAWSLNHLSMWLTCCSLALPGPSSTCTVVIIQ